MAANETIWKIGDDTNVILRKILESLQGGGFGSGALEVQQADLTYTLDSVSIHPPTTLVVASVALAASQVVKASAGKLLHLTGYSNKGSAQFIQIHNTTSLPANGSVPTFLINVAATSPFSFTIPLLGADFTTGITVANSSTAATLTVGSNDCFFTAVVI